jgi:hypothetical protein
MQHEWMQYDASEIAVENPRAIADASTPVKITGGWRKAALAARRLAESCATCATDRRVVTDVAFPYFNNSQDATKSDQDPRGSLGSQNPYAQNIACVAMITTKR